MSKPEHAPLDTRRRRLLYRATHRGTHENDLLVGGFVSARISALTDQDLDALEEVLELPDVALSDWLTGRQPIPPELDSPMLRRIRDAAPLSSSWPGSTRPSLAGGTSDRREADCRVKPGNDGIKGNDGFKGDDGFHGGDL